MLPNGCSRTPATLFGSVAGQFATPAIITSPTAITKTDMRFVPIFKPLLSNSAENMYGYLQRKTPYLFIVQFPFFFSIKS
jgi:hypothetical protein